MGSFLSGRVLQVESPNYNRLTNHLVWCRDRATNSTNGTGGGGNLTLTVNTTSLAHSGDWVTVTWRNVHNPTSSNWIGVYLPTVSGTIDARNHAPIKFQVRYIVTDIFYQY